MSITESVVERKMLQIFLKDQILNQIIRQKRHCETCQCDEVEMDRTCGKDDRRQLDDMNKSMETQDREKVWRQTSQKMER
jgi:hypothetical protein